MRLVSTSLDSICHGLFQSERVAKIKPVPRLLNEDQPDINLILISMITIGAISGFYYSSRLATSIGFIYFTQISHVTCN